MPSRWTYIAFALGLVSATGFAPLDLWPLTLICLAAWMHLVWKADTLKTALARGYAFGIGHFIVGLNWIAGAFQYQDAMPVWLGWIAVVALSFYIAIYPAAAAGLAWRWGRGRPAAFVLFFAAAWVVTEWLRAVVFTGFAWNPLGVVWATVPFISEISRTIGTYGLSGLIVLSGGLLGYRVNRLRDDLGVERSVAAFSLVVALAVIWFSFVIWPMFGERSDENGPLIRVVQPNIGQQDKYEPGYDAINFDKLKRLTGKPGPEPRLILWPEAAIPDYLDEKGGEARYGRWRIAALLGPKDMIITGGVKREFKVTRRANYIERDLIGARNNVWAMTPNQQLLWRYDKAHLVPYGEYLPMKPLLSAIGLSRLVPGDIDFWPGPGPQSYNVPGFGKVGLQICYEIVFSGEVIDRDNRPDFLFNPSNDAWFGAWGPPQHLAQARLRAIEEGIPIVRATPTGISAVIDADGRVLNSIPLGEAGFIETHMPTPHPPTLFARYGNILPFAFALFLTAIGVALRRRPR